jgi:hypothetical protein
MSRRNSHEAHFLVALCRYLILQGYEPNTITILAAYTAQMFYIKNVSNFRMYIYNISFMIPFSFITTNVIQL